MLCGRARARHEWCAPVLPATDQLTLRAVCHMWDRTPTSQGDRPNCRTAFHTHARRSPPVPRYCGSHDADRSAECRRRMHRTASYAPRLPFPILCLTPLSRGSSAASMQRVERPSASTTRNEAQRPSDECAMHDATTATQWQRDTNSGSAWQQERLTNRQLQTARSHPSGSGRAAAGRAREACTTATARARL